MDITEYISFYYKGETPVSKYQYITKEAKEYYVKNHQALKYEIAMFYQSRALPVLGAIKPSLIYPFLDYHLQAYQGDPLDFFYMVKDIKAVFSNSGTSNCFDNLWLDNVVLKQVLEEWILEKKAETKALKVSISHSISQMDTRIRVNSSNEEIQKYFIYAFVNTKDKKGFPYFSEDEVMHFLHANFADFNPKKEIRKLKSLAFQPQAYIRRTIRAFYIQYTTGNRENRRYCELIRDNFMDFENCDFEETIVKNFSR